MKNYRDGRTRSKDVVNEAQRSVCICDGKKHWVKRPDGTRLLLTAHRLNPYCKAHDQVGEAGSEDSSDKGKGGK